MLLSSYLTHCVPLGDGGARVEAVRTRLIVYRDFHRLTQLIVRAAASDKRAQVGGVGVAQAGL